MKPLLSALSFCTLLFSHSLPAHSFDTLSYGAYSCTKTENHSPRQSYASPSTDTLSSSIIASPALLIVPTLLLVTIMHKSAVIPENQPFPLQARQPEAIINNNNFIPVNDIPLLPSKKKKEPRSTFKNTLPKCSGMQNGGKGKKVRIQKYNFKPGR